MRKSLVVLAVAVLLGGAGCDSSLLAQGSGNPGGGGGTPGTHSNPDAGTGGHLDLDGGPAPTWYRDVLPIVQTNCQGCHVAGGIGPFALESYEEAAPLAASLANAVENRRMPPWMPDPSCNSYQDERRLTQAQIDTLSLWALAGAPEGDPADAPPPPEARAELPWVDATLDLGVDYTPDSSGPDDYHCFVVDPNLTSEQDVIGFDIVPQVRSEVHHVLLYSATKADAQSKDDATPGAGWTCFGGPGTSNPQVVGGWVPGTPVTQYPENTGVRLKAGTVLVVQVHYNLQSGPPAPDRTQIKLQYAKTPVSKPAYILAEAQWSFAIPPNSTGYTATDTESGSPVAVTVYGVLPHMHTLGRQIRVETTSGQCLVDIPKWDFHWQQFYFFKTPVQVPAGQARKMTCTWDNPNPTTVTWGEGTSDEMCLNYVYVTL